MGVGQKRSIQFGEGWVWHARPNAAGCRVQNSFRYRIFNLLIPVHDDAETEKLRHGWFLSVLPESYLNGRSGSLKDNVREFLKVELNYVCDEIWLQTLPRLFGFVFNPVSFWYCCRDGKVEAILCEVNNTFGDRHFYFIKDFGDHQGDVHQAQKTFHVSPFFAVDGIYTFEFQKAVVGSDVRIRLYQSDQLQLDTQIQLEYRDFKEVSRGYILRKYGWMTFMVIFRIHFQALRIWIKGAQFFRRPSPPKEKITYVYAKHD